MDTVGQELRLATRRLLRAPAFTVATVLTLALAIGANTAIFAVVRNVVVNPLPYPQSDRLIALQYIFPQAPGPATTAMPVALYYQYADRARTLADIAIYRRDELTTPGDTAQSARGIASGVVIPGRWRGPVRGRGRPVPAGNVA